MMSDNGPANVSKEFAKTCHPLGLRHIRTRPYTPETEGKAERCIQTLCKEWAYGMPFQHSEERVRWLPRYWRAITASRSTQSSGGAHLRSGYPAVPLTNLVRQNT